MGTAIDLSQRYSYADYLTWDDGERWEIMDGLPYNMTAAPSRRHQRVLGRLFSRFSNYFKSKPCEVYISPFDVRLAEDISDDYLIENVVQPDLSVFCDKSKLDDKGAIGAPDLVVEVLSPATATKDLKSKILIYQRYGVREYWIVDPLEDWVDVLVIGADGRYGLGKQVSGEDFAVSSIFPELKIKCIDLFDKE